MRPIPKFIDIHPS